MASSASKELVNQQFLASGQSSASRISRRTDQFLAVLKATAVNAATTLDVKIQHSPNNSDWFDVTGGAFTQLVGVGGDEVIDISAKLLPFLRIDVVLAGATQDATIKVDMFYDADKDV